MLLELRGISLNVENGNGSAEILRDVNMALQERRLYVITGPNGGGKSSLAKVIMGILRPTEGRVYFKGRDITALDVTERARLGIGYAFQQPPRFKGITIGELLRLAAGKRDTDRICDYLFALGLCPQEYLGREIDAGLSGGELKRVELATLLARKPELAIYDEPEAGIDLWSFGKLVDALQKAHEERLGTTVIISHHERILKLADKIILMANGQIQKRGDWETVGSQIMEDCTCRRECAERSVRYAEYRG